MESGEGGARERDMVVGKEDCRNGKRMEGEV